MVTRVFRIKGSGPRKVSKPGFSMTAVARDVAWFAAVETKGSTVGSAPQVGPTYWWSPHRIPLPPRQGNGPWLKGCFFWGRRMTADGIGIG